MRTWIFSEKSYKKALKRLIHESESPRGMVSRIADAIGCQRSYLSQVLHSKVQLTRDQAWGICEFFGLSKQESRYFELLVDHERSTSPTFRRHLEQELQEARDEATRIATRFSESSGFNEEEARSYYASWIPCALHILTSISEFHDEEKIARRLGISIETTRDHLSAMQGAGLVKKAGNRWEFSGGAKFVPRESPFVVFHHQNWRGLAVEDSRHPRADGLHYTMVQSISRTDYEKLQAMILDFIEKSQKLAAPSEPQVLTALNIDFFEPLAEFK